MKKDFHILALSGGGFRGLYTATILEKIEEAYKEPLANAFDLICGTSIGGILALGLAAEIPSRNLKNIFIENGKEIFSPKLGFFQKFLFKHTKLSSSAAYSPKKLEQILKRHFGDKKIGDLKHRVLIPTVNCETGLGQFIKTPHHVSFKFDWKWSVVDAALATSAAPTYFPIFKNQVGRFVDGALVGNAPGLFGYHEAKYFLSDNDEELNIRILCIGTANQRFGLAGNHKLDIGFFGWRENLINLSFSAQEGANFYILGHLLGQNLCYVDDQPSIDQARDIGLDKVSNASITVLQNLANSRAQKLLGSSEFDVFLKHRALAPTFYYGPNAAKEIL